MVSENTNPIWLFSDCLGISIVKMTDTEINSFESFRMFWSIGDGESVHGV